MEFTLVQRIVRIRFEEEVLQSNHHRIQVEHGFPVFSKDVQTNVALEVDIWMVDLMRKYVKVCVFSRRYDSYFWYAFDLWRVVWIVCVDCKRESESATLVHAFKRNQFDE
jgi:hypothetical protein